MPIVLTGKREIKIDNAPIVIGNNTLRSAITINHTSRNTFYFARAPSGSGISSNSATNNQYQQTDTPINGTTDTRFNTTLNSFNNVPQLNNSANNIPEFVFLHPQDQSFSTSYEDRGNDEEDYESSTTTFIANLLNPNILSDQTTNTRESNNIPDANTTNSETQVSNTQDINKSEKSALKQNKFNIQLFTNTISILKSSIDYCIYKVKNILTSIGIICIGIIGADYFIISAFTRFFSFYIIENLKIVLDSEYIGFLSLFAPWIQYFIEQISSIALIHMIINIFIDALNVLFVERYDRFLSVAAKILYTIRIAR